MTPSEKLQELYTLRHILDEYCDPYVAVKPTFFDTSTPLDELKQAASLCHLCPLSKGRKAVVFGQGKTNAPLMIIGQWPTQDDEKTGISLGGKTRETLTVMIEKVLQFSLDDVYFTTLVKCKPALANNPSLHEQEQCFAYLEGEINAVSPRAILTLGEEPFHLLTHSHAPLQKERGHTHYYKNIPLVPTYHPTFLARNPSERQNVYDDLLTIKALLS